MESVYKPSEVQQHMNIDIFLIDGGLTSSPLDHVMISRRKNRRTEALRAVVYYHYLATAESYTGNASSRKIPNVGKNVADTMCGLGDIRKNF